ncbi:MAG: universal stress protein [Alphaproteobacteria bacterium]|nr:universal stress protein [Alphaproteobacteria bacterium]
MSIRKILVPLTGEARDAPALAVAFAVARRHQAHVLGLFVRSDPRTTLPYLGEGVSGAVIEDLMNASKEASDQAEKAARAAFETAAGLAHVPVVAAPHGPGSASAMFRGVMGVLVAAVSEEARLSDLVVFDRTREGDPGIPDAFEECLMAAGRPILLAPREAPADLGKRVTIGWDGSSEAAHAVREALPFLRAAEGVEILSVGPKPSGAEKTAPLLGYLALHGVSASEHWVDPKGAAIGEVLLREAERGGADLVVMGGYGHSRLREFIVGGATRHILANAALPVLIAH